MHAVSLTPDAKCMRYNWHRMHNKIFEQIQKVKTIYKMAMLYKKNLKFMRFHWPRMHSAFGVIDT
jgi:hypothetical protein